MLCAERAGRARRGARAAAAGAGGRLVCPCFRPELGGCGGWFTERTIAWWLDEADYARYDALRQAEVQRRVWLEMNERVEKTVHEMARRLQQSAPQLPKRLLAEQLRMSIPGARMCGRCRHGPIEHFACSDLRTHWHESYAGNACPKCGWFAGDMPDSAVAAPPPTLPPTPGPRRPAMKSL